MILTTSEGEAACREIAALIRAAGTTAQITRRVNGNRLFGSDAELWQDLERTPIELLETPPADLGRAIDAKANLLPGCQVEPADRLHVNGQTYTVQTLAPANLFGYVTHLVAELVLVHEV